MMPVEIDGNDPRSLLSDIFDDGKFVVFNPLHSQVHNLSGNVMTLEKVRQSEEPHGQEIDPDEMIDRPVVIGQLGNMKEETVK
jgi:hypothetical protein